MVNVRLNLLLKNRNVMPTMVFILISSLDTMGLGFRRIKSYYVDAVRQSPISYLFFKFQLSFLFKSQVQPK